MGIPHRTTELRRVAIHLDEEVDQVLAAQFPKPVWRRFPPSIADWQRLR
jgi:hypothetical protein